MKDMQNNEPTVFFGSTPINTTFINHPYNHNKNTEIILYTIYLPAYNHLIKDLKPFLNNKENEKATKYYKDIDRKRFIICRSLLKFALAHYTNSNINDILIDLLSNKKPYILSHPNVYFNVSHSNNYGIIAISSNQIGIDIERVDNVHEDTIPYVFTENEIQFINTSDNKAQAFYSLWTRKEAFVKALGKGIDDDFSKIPCLDGYHGLDTLLIISSQHWQVHNFKIDEGYLGAIAVPIINNTHINELYFNTFPTNIENIVRMNF